jgi:hypothetical protein
MALIVEDGSAVAGAESYISVADADNYIGKWVADPAAWQALATSAKENKLRQATQYLDAVFVTRWKGYIATSGQSLNWPRQYAYDERGNSIEGTVPLELRRATATVAAAAAAAPLVPLGGSATTDNQAIVEQEVEVGPIKRRTKYAEPAALSSGGFPKIGAAGGIIALVSSMLSPLLSGGGSGSVMRS